MRGTERVRNTTRAMHYWIWTTLTAAIAIVPMLAPSPASAALGGDVTSVEADRAKMEATLQTTSRNGYSVHEIQSPSGIVVREFVSPAGKVFGVAWHGPARPDLRQLLGTYFAQFQQAAQNQQLHRVARGPLVIQQPGFVLVMGGHQHAFTGKAYVPQMMPAGVTTQELR